MVEDLLGRADLLDLALVHDHDPVAHLERLLLVVGHEDAGDPDLVVQPAQPAAQLLAHLRVQGAEGLVEEQHLGLHRQGAGQGHALALAAGELRGVAVAQPVELHQLQEVGDLRSGSPPPRGGARRGRTRRPKATFSNTVMWRKRA